MYEKTNLDHVAMSSSLALHYPIRAFSLIYCLVDLCDVW